MKKLYICIDDFWLAGLDQIMLKGTVMAAFNIDDLPCTKNKSVRELWEFFK